MDISDGILRVNGWDSSMTEERYKALMADENLRLTPDELVDGWHFCWDWDGLLIHKDHPEAKVCTCNKSYVIVEHAK